MTKIIVGTLIFCIVLFMYLHIMFHLKTSDDLEIYEIDETSKEKIEEIFDLRQPVLFYFHNQQIIQASNKTTISSHFGSSDIKIRNMNDHCDIEGENADTDSDLHVPLSINVANKLFHEDKNASYFSENNREFLEDSGIKKTFKMNDAYLRPAMMSNCYYDVLFGSKNVFTPFRYNINYRNFFLVTQGSIQIKISPPYNKKHLYVNYDYENFEFRSPINPWSPQNKYKADFERVKCAEFVLTPGKMLFLPPYWFYSIRFLDANTSVSCFHYRTYMNNVAISPYICLHLLQLQNIKRTNTIVTTSNNTSNNTINIYQEEQNQEQEEPKDEITTIQINQTDTEDPNKKNDETITDVIETTSIKDLDNTILINE